MFTLAFYSEEIFWVERNISFANSERGVFMLEMAASCCYFCHSRMKRYASPTVLITEMINRVVI